MSEESGNVIDELVVEVGIDADTKSFDRGAQSIDQVHAQTSKAAESASQLNIALAATGKQLRRLPKAQPIVAPVPMGGANRRMLPALPQRGGVNLPAVIPDARFPGDVTPPPTGKPKMRQGGYIGKLGAAAGGYFTASHISDAMSSADAVAKMARAYNIDPLFLQALGHLHPSYGGTEAEGFNLLQMLNQIQSSMTMGTMPSNISAAQTYATTMGAKGVNFADVFDDRTKSRQQLLEGLIREFDKIKNPQVKQETMTAFGINQVGSRNILQGGFDEFARTVNSIANSRLVYKPESLENAESFTQGVSDTWRAVKVGTVNMVSDQMNVIKSVKKDIQDLDKLRIDKIVERRVDEKEAVSQQLADQISGADRRVIINQTINQTINGGGSAADIIASDTAKKTADITVKSVRQAQQQIEDR
jgi:hypothetical protein